MKVAVDNLVSASRTAKQGAEPDPKATVPGLRARNRTIVRNRILEVARDVFIAEGVHGADLAKVAQRADIARATLYRYFDGKDALLLGLMDEDWGLQAAYFERLVNRPDLGRSAIEDWLRGLMRATKARVDSFHFYYAGDGGAVMMDRLTGQREKLMAILSRKFAGFDRTEQNAAGRVTAFFLIYDIENFVAHAAVSDNTEEIDAGVALLCDRLAERLA